MTFHYQLITASAAMFLSFASLENDKLHVAKPNACNIYLDFINSKVDGGKCNTFGYDKYVQNSDANAAYSVTVKVDSFKAGEGSKEFQKVIIVPAGSKTYSPETGGPSYTYTMTLLKEFTIRPLKVSYYQLPTRFLPQFLTIRSTLYFHI